MQLDKTAITEYNKSVNTQNVSIDEHNSLAIAYNKLYKLWELSGKKNKAFSNRLVTMWKRIQELQTIIHEPKGQAQL